MPHILYQVDAFTNEPFEGNPAGVCLLNGSETTEWMQALAAEMNLSETAFLLPEGAAWRLRWFTPITEVDLCGHATLASARVLFEHHPELRKDVIKFKTLSGILLARWGQGRVELDFPAMAYEPYPVTTEISEILGFHPTNAVFSGNYFLFEAEDPQRVLKAKPDMAALVRLPMPEVIITAKSPWSDYDFISRFFAPQLGVDEDPVTGSAHCLLTPYWSEKLGKDSFKAFQASQRGGKLWLRLIDDRVRIAGDACIVFKADLLV